MKNFKPEDKFKKGSKCKKGSKPRSKKYSKPKDTDDVKKVSDDINDASYYYDNPDLLAQLTNYSFEQFMGMPAEVGTQYARTRYWAGNILTVWLNPSVQPTTDDSFSSLYGINMAAVKNYLLLSANNAKTTNYGPQDPMALTLAMRSCVEMYSFIKRAFGIAYLYNTRNRDYPNRLLSAMGINPDLFRADLAAYRVRFNTDVALLDRIPFPKDIPCIKKAEEIYAGIYLDEASPMAQTYMFCPYSVWQINEAYNPQGIGLETIQVKSANLEDFDYFLSIFESLITALGNSSLLNYVYSDILRVCGSNLFTLETVSEVYNVLPNVNPETRIWLHNMIVVGHPLELDQVPPGMTTGTTTSNDVETNTNGDGLNYHPRFKFTTQTGRYGFNVLYNALVDFETLNPSVEERVAATRLAFRSKVVGSNVAGFEGIYSDSLPVLGDYYVTDAIVDDGFESNPFLTVLDGTDTWSTTTFTKLMTLEGKLSQFNFSPLLYLTGNNTNNDGSYLHAVHGDLNYFTTLDYEYMQRMRDAEMMSEFSFSRSMNAK